MGKLTQGILGGISGSVGNVVGSSWKGIPVIKAKPLSVANPRTAGQVAQRSKLANVVEFAKPLLSTVIKPLWDRFASQQSGYNSFIAANIDLFENPTPTPPENLRISTGKMAATPVVAFSVEINQGYANVGWLVDSGEGMKLDDDEAYSIVVNESKQDTLVISSSVTRQDESLEPMPIPDTWEVGDICHAYLAFRRADGTVVSETSHLEVAAV